MPEPSSADEGTPYPAFTPFSAEEVAHIANELGRSVQQRVFHDQVRRALRDAQASLPISDNSPLDDGARLVYGGRLTENFFQQAAAYATGIPLEFTADEPSPEPLRTPLDRFSRTGRTTRMMLAVLDYTQSHPLARPRVIFTTHAEAEDWERWIKSRTPVYNPIRVEVASGRRSELVRQVFTDIGVRTFVDPRVFEEAFREEIEGYHAYDDPDAAMPAPAPQAPPKPQAPQRRPSVKLLRVAGE